MTLEQDISCAKRTIDKEVEALRALEASFDQSLSAALDLMQNAQGRVIVTGMGKSGHIGRKIAATLASTGTPSFFVHPAEASHGYLGIFTEKDVVLAISNGGESKELSDKELIKEIKERIGGLDVRDNIERRAYEIALASLEAEPVAWKATFTQIDNEYNTFTALYSDKAEAERWVRLHEIGDFRAEITPLYAAPSAPVIPALR